MAWGSAWEEWERVIRDPGSGPLDVLKAVGVYQRYLAAIEQAAAKAARAEGHTWEEIGDAIGVTRQSAWQRLRALKAAADLQSLMVSGAADEALGRTMRFEPPASIVESARGPVSYIVIFRDGAPVCAVWAGSAKRQAGVVAAPGNEREAQRWRLLLLSAATSQDFHATDFVAFWVEEGRPGYEVSAVQQAESLDVLRSRIRELAA